MPIVSPSVAMRGALAAHLAAGLQVTPGLESSAVLGRWPEPTEDLTLGPARVVVGLEIGAEPKLAGRIGGPYLARVTLGEGTAAEFRYDYDQIEQEIAIGLWASSEALRDEADEAVFDLLNRPFWSTVAPVVDTTTTATAEPGERWVTVADLGDVWPGAFLRIDEGGNEETVRVLAVSPVAFLARFNRSHLAGVGVVEVAARNELAASGLHLRLENHHNVIASLRFGEARRLQDAQRQEWRSVRKGTGYATRVRVVEGTARQSSAVSAQISARNPAAEAPIVTTAYEPDP